MVMFFLQCICQAVKTKLQQTVCSQLAIEKPLEQQIPSERDRLGNHFTSQLDLSDLSHPLKNSTDAWKNTNLKGLLNNCDSHSSCLKGFVEGYIMQRADYLEVDYQHSDHILLRKVLQKD